MHAQLYATQCTQSFTSASKNSLRSLGTKHLHVSLEDGSQTGMKCEVLKVHRALMSVSRVVDQGHSVVFQLESKGGSYILGKNSLKHVPLKTKEGVYVLPVSVLSGNENENGSDGRAMMFMSHMPTSVAETQDALSTPTEVADRQEKEDDIQGRDDREKEDRERESRLKWLSRRRRE